MLETKKKTYSTKKWRNNPMKKKYGPELVPECKGCIFADETKQLCTILSEPSWFWQKGKTCSFRKEQISNEVKGI